MKKIVLSNSLFFVLLASLLLCFVASMSCGGADSTDEDTDSADVGADVTADDDGGDVEDPDAPCIDCDVNMLDEGNTDQASEETGGEDIAGCPLGCECCADYDCACVEWPQVVEYMWLERKWKRVEVDGKPADNKIVDIEITAWDDTLGAEVQTFTPYGPPYPYLRFKKNTNNGQFEAINPETKQVVGYGDSVSLKIEYDSELDVGIIHHSVWEALE